MDRWSIVTTLNYLPHDKEVEIVARQGASLPNDRRASETARRMVRVADLTRAGLHQRRPVDRDEPAHGHHLGRERQIFGDLGFAFRVTFLNKCDELERTRGGRVLPALLRRGPAGKRSTRRSAAEELCDEENSTGCAPSSTSSSPICRAPSARLANRLQRRLMAQQNRSWDFDLEEGYLDTARLTRVVIDPMQPLSFKRSATPSSATRW
jgi:hypothetical protein